MSLPPIFGLQAFFVLGRVNILSATAHAYRGFKICRSVWIVAIYNDHALNIGSNNQRVIFSPRSVHGSVHVSDSIPLS